MEFTRYINGPLLRNNSVFVLFCSVLFFSVLFGSVICGVKLKIRFEVHNFSLDLKNIHEQTQKNSEQTNSVKKKKREEKATYTFPLPAPTSPAGS